jgi:hypothetical protein
MVFGQAIRGESMAGRAWCLRCHENFGREGEWNEKNEGTLKAKLLCSSCYEAKRAHQTSADWDDFLREATEYRHHASSGFSHSSASASGKNIITIWKPERSPFPLREVFA